MVGTLGLDDDWEPIDVVIAVESAFDIKIENKEAEALFTVGELFGLLLSKIAPSDAAGKCASAMAFYRVRRTLFPSETVSKLPPSHDLSALRSAYTKRFVKELEAKSGLKWPKPSFTWVGNVGTFLAIGGIFGALLAIVLALASLAISRHFGDWLANAAAVLVSGGLVVGCTMAWLDRGQLPRSCDTLGKLAEKSATLNYGRLMRDGADARPEAMWKALTDVLAEFSGVPAEQIERGTVFLQSTFDKAKKAAA